jgi:kynureninase
MTDDLLKYRSEFPILEKAVYLISHSLGAMPRATYDRLREYADIWAARGVRAWAEGWWDKPVTIGNEVAPIIGGSQYRRHASECFDLPVVDSFSTAAALAIRSGTRSFLKS